MKDFDELKPHEQDELHGGMMAGLVVGGLYGFCGGLFASALLMAITPIEMPTGALVVRCVVVTGAMAAVGAFCGKVVGWQSEMRRIEMGHYDDPMNRTRVKSMLKVIRDHGITPSDEDK